MQITVYTCDFCLEIIGDEPHLSLRMNAPDTGFAMPPFAEVNGNATAHWTVRRFKAQFIHLHTEHAGPFFRDCLNETLGRGKYRPTTGKAGTAKRAK